MSEQGTVGQGVAAELLHCELQLMLPETRHNGKRLGALLAVDFVEIGASGRVWSREETLESLTVEEFEPPIVEDFQCRRLAAGVVLVTYRAVRRDAETSERQTTLRSSVWSKHAKTWALRFHQGTRVGAAASPTPRGA
jgi:ribonuclease HI